MDSRSKKILAVLVALFVVAGGAYVAVAALGPDETTTDARPEAGEVLANTDLMVRAVDPDNPASTAASTKSTTARSGAAPATSPASGSTTPAGTASAWGSPPPGSITTRRSSTPKLKPVDKISLTGLPSRARVSADGRYGAMTVFVSGDSYLESPTAFSTRTTILDMSDGSQIGQLEQFDVSKDGKPFDAVDFNFWGVTFAKDPNRFYATLGTGGEHYLVEGNVREKTMRVLRDGVECPSLSPDNKRIAYKSRIGSENRWRLRVLDLGTLEDHAVAESKLDRRPGRVARRRHARLLRRSQRLHGARRRRRRSEAAGQGRDLTGAVGRADELGRGRVRSGARRSRPSLRRRRGRARGRRRGAGTEAMSSSSPLASRSST